jgi:hypothetical protein
MAGDCLLAQPPGGPLTRKQSLGLNISAATCEPILTLNNVWLNLPLQGSPRLPMPKNLQRSNKLLYNPI